jgi:hypothetical protein
MGFQDFRNTDVGITKLLSLTGGRLIGTRSVAAPARFVNGLPVGHMQRMIEPCHKRSSREPKTKKRAVTTARFCFRQQIELA